MWDWHLAADGAVHGVRIGFGFPRRCSERLRTATVAAPERSLASDYAKTCDASSSIEH